MRFCILGDTHWGVRGDLALFHDHYEKFYDYLFTELKRQGITTIFQLGDLFDRRKYVNFRTLAKARSVFFDRMRDEGITLHTLIGNHDIHYRESLDINSASLLLNDYDNVKIYTSPTTVEIEGATIDMIPWICAENEEEIKQFIADSKSDLCFGHFEINTFSMYRGVESHGGLCPSLFAKYEKVCSGHYHTRSSRENIVYVGTPYEMTWQDYNDPKGYSVFDTITRELVFNQNPFNIFHRIEYTNNSTLADLDALDLHNCFVKVVV